MFLPYRATGIIYDQAPSVNAYMVHWHGQSKDEPPEPPPHLSFRPKSGATATASGGTCFSWVRPRLQTSLTPHPPYNVVIQNEADRRAKRSGRAVKDPSSSCSATAASRCSPINLARCHSDRARSAATASGGTCFFAACSQQPRRRNPHRLNPCHPERSERRAKRTGRAVKDPCNSSSATAA
jgi:hypothetical protein